MPFAIVMGEAMTELPKDLYIPPRALEIILEAFEGPLDLLLYLIQPSEPRYSRDRRVRDHRAVHALCGAHGCHAV